ncbi:hypothetical protein HCX49_16365 [Sphingobacterium kitahiroshimense]|jgi:hypothetical protein|uniref:hypothetical protein n=1 Tax=Sphingobacterium sp. B16(2022) TaxID=2914044 RepID=UPI001438E4DF|nr:hypothetical protein [Sphingobacterium sp. B16(2022)]NJI74778.1 hypothetical protein [Sphingobacterium sp. B16(2022)]
MKNSIYKLTLFLVVLLFSCSKQNGTEITKDELNKISSTKSQNINLLANGPPSITLEVTVSGTIINTKATLVGVSGATQINGSIECLGVDGTYQNSAIFGSTGTANFQGIASKQYNIKATFDYLINGIIKNISLTKSITISSGSGNNNCTYPSSLTSPQFPDIITNVGPNNTDLHKKDNEILVLFPNDLSLNTYIVLLYREKNTQDQWLQTPQFHSSGTGSLNGPRKTYYVINGLKSGTEYEIKSAILCAQTLLIYPTIFTASTMYE